MSIERGSLLFTESANVYNPGTGYTIFDRYPANQPNYFSIREKFDHIPVLEGSAKPSKIDKIQLGTDSVLIHAPERWSVNPVGGGYRAILTIPFPALGIISPGDWIELTIYCSVTSQHGDVGYYQPNINFNNLVKRSPPPQYQLLPTGDTTYNVAVQAGVLFGVLKDYLKNVSIQITWDVSLHGDIIEEFGHELNVWLRMAFAKATVVHDD